MSKVDRDKVKRAYLESDESMASIAARFGLSSKTLQRWSDDDPEGSWVDRRKAKGIATKPRPIVSTPNPDNVVPLRKRSRGGEIDELEIVDIAIGDVSAVMGGGDIDARGVGSCASALCRLIELRLKLKPRTAADLADLVIGLGVSPAEFSRELREKWQLRA